MNVSSNRVLKLLLMDPLGKVKMTVDQCFSVSVEILALNVDEYSVNLKFDHNVLMQISPHPNPYVSAEVNSPHVLTWQMKAIAPTNTSTVVIQATADSLFQQSQFLVEVIST